mgnify:FL=1
MKREAWRPLLYYGDKLQAGLFYTSLHKTEAEMREIRKGLDCDEKINQKAFFFTREENS